MSDPEPSQAPRPARRTESSTAHGDTREDAYAWMREPNDEVLTHLRAERAWAEHRIDRGRAGFRAELAAEMRARVREADQSVPVREGPWLYYSRTEDDREYGIHCRRLETMDAPEQVYLDENERAEAHEYFSLPSLTISPDHRWMAYAVDTTGDEVHDVRIEDLETGELLDEVIGNVGGSLAWASDSKTLFYDVLDDAHRPYQILRHERGTDPKLDVVVYKESDPSHYVGVHRSRDESWIVIGSGSQITSEVWSIAADDPMAAPTLRWPRRHGVEASIEPAGADCFVVTNQDAPNFRLYRAPRTSLDDPSTWKEILEPREDVYLEGVDAFERFWIAWERENGLRRVRVFARDGRGAAWTVPLPDPVYALWPGANPDYRTHTLRFGYSSPTRPSSVFEVDLEAPPEDVEGLRLLKQREVVGGHDPAAYRCERLWIPSSDGRVRIPVTMVYRHEFDPNEAARPMVIYGYGAYGASMEAYFSANRLSLLDRGVAWAVAHVRGGSELGRPWYEDGKLEHKQNTFTDFTDCAAALIDAGLTSADRLGAWGGSAGGLLVGAAINQRPELFALAVADVPFVDVLTTLQDASLPLTIVEWEEWGNPEKAEEYDWIRAYSPYDNVSTGRYPHVLASAGLSDPRVGFWEPAKWVARLRHRRSDDGETLLWTQMDGGHGGASGRFEALHELALQYAFVLGHLLP